MNGFFLLDVGSGNIRTREKAELIVFAWDLIAGSKPIISDVFPLELRSTVSTDE